MSKDAFTDSDTEIILRPARSDEIEIVREWLMEAIDTSPFYCDEFKAHEKRRMSRVYLQRLHEADPGHLLFAGPPDAPEGIMVSSPEFGALWLHWSYLKPEHRRGRTAIVSLRAFVEYWDNGRFHKIVTICRTTNKASRVLLHRYGFTQVAELNEHMFGEDYLMFERKLNKAIAGYDTGIAPEGRLGRLRRRVLSLAGHGRGA